MIKPFDKKDILSSIRSSERILIIEEGVQSFGWGAEVSSFINENEKLNLKFPIQRIGQKTFQFPVHLY